MVGMHAIAVPWAHTRETLYQLLWAGGVRQPYVTQPWNRPGNVEAPKLHWTCLTLELQSTTSRLCGPCHVMRKWQKDAEEL